MHNHHFPAEAEGSAQYGGFLKFYYDFKQIHVIFSAVVRVGSRMQLHPQIFEQKQKNIGKWPKKSLGFNMLDPQS